MHEGSEALAEKPSGPCSLFSEHLGSDIREAAIWESRNPVRMGRGRKSVPGRRNSLQNLRVRWVWIVVATGL